MAASTVIDRNAKEVYLEIDAFWYRYHLWMPKAGDWIASKDRR